MAILLNNYKNRSAADVLFILHQFPQSLGPNTFFEKQI